MFPTTISHQQANIYASHIITIIRTAFISPNFTPRDILIPTSSHQKFITCLYSKGDIRGKYDTFSIMSSTNRPSSNTPSENDAMSTMSKSTMASTKSLLRSILPHKRSKNAEEPRKTESPAEKAKRDLDHAEALHTSALYK
jgi:hypothetical protein